MPFNAEILSAFLEEDSHSGVLRVLPADFIASSFWKELQVQLHQECAEGRCKALQENSFTQSLDSVVIISHRYVATSEIAQKLGTKISIPTHSKAVKETRYLKTSLNSLRVFGIP